VDGGFEHRRFAHSGRTGNHNDATLTVLYRIQSIGNQGKYRRAPVQWSRPTAVLIYFHDHNGNLIQRFVA
jgi:hypothetical protein